MSKAKKVVDTATGELFEKSVPWATVRNPHTGNRYEKVSTLSMTIPNDAYTLREILKRFSQGQPVNGMRMPMYHGDEAIVMTPERWRSLDLAERDEYLKQVRKYKTSIELELKRKADEDIKKRKDAEFAAAVKNEIEKQAAKEKGAENAPK